MCDCIASSSEPVATPLPIPHIRHEIRYVPCEKPTQTFEEYRILLFLRRNQIDVAKAKQLLMRAQARKYQVIRNGGFGDPPPLKRRSV